MDKRPCNMDNFFMTQALAEAYKAFDMQEIPVGAVIVDKCNIIARGFNQCINKVDPTAHAEIIVIRQAAKRNNNYRLNNCSIYITVQPCIMCIGAITNARLKRVVFGTFNNKLLVYTSLLKLALKKQFNYVVNDIQVIDDYESSFLCSKLIKDFLRTKRHKT
jgi:tRNA(adenine34) deaminase